MLKSARCVEPSRPSVARAGVSAEIASSSSHSDPSIVSDPPVASRSGTSPARRVHAVVALRILEALRDQDLPGEFLEDENPTRTMPRRFGLSDVVERQIRKFDAEARRGVRLTDAEVTDLFRFVIRRPDGREVFDHVGRSLAGPGPSPRWLAFLPSCVRYGLARRRARRHLRHLFGRAIGGFARGLFVIEGRALLFVESDPGGEACHLLSGFCESVLEEWVGGEVVVVHSLCQARGDPLCRWESRSGEGGGVERRVAGRAS